MIDQIHRSAKLNGEQAQIELWSYVSIETEPDHNSYICWHLFLYFTFMAVFGRATYLIIYYHKTWMLCII